MVATLKHHTLKFSGKFKDKKHAQNLTHTFK